MPPDNKKKNSEDSIKDKYPVSDSKRNHESAEYKTEYNGKEYSGDENKERGNWSDQLDFLLSCLGFAVGLGNVWRFPYLCYRNGGGAFFIPYFIMLIFIGIPLFYMELSLGQFCSSGPLTCWKFAPILKGVGIAQMVISGMVSIYYNMIIAWSLYYLVVSVQYTLPWSSCDNAWNTEVCSQKDIMQTLTCVNHTHIRYDNGTCYSNDTRVGIWNYTMFHKVTNISKLSPSSEFYNNKVLNISEGIDDMGEFQWQLVLSLFSAWSISYFCMIKGIKSTGKVVYFTAIFPFIVLIILFCRGVTLPNAWNGISFYITPSFDKLRDAKVWNDAAIQIFFSLSNSWGGLIALSSYNRFHNNVFNDTVIVCVGNCFTSIFAGVVIFSFIGYMAGDMNADIADVVDKGPGLAFIVYPDAISRMPFSPVWSILFFLMLITLGLDSQFTMLETIMTSLMDEFKPLRKRKEYVTLVMCITLGILGLPLCTRGGAYILQLMDSYAGGWGLLIIGLFETISIGWWYGSDRFLLDIEVMTAIKPTFWWKLCWQYISPVILTAVLLFTWIDYSPARYGDYYFPFWADSLGWIMTSSSVIWIPIYAIYAYMKSPKSHKETIKYLTKPTDDWGPALLKHRLLVKHVPGFKANIWGKTKPNGLNLEQNTNGVALNYIKP